MAQLWQHTGLTALLITHDVEEALVMAQRVHVLTPNPGRIIHTMDVTLEKSDLEALRVDPDFLHVR